MAGVRQVSQTKMPRSAEGAQILRAYPVVNFTGRVRSGVGNPNRIGSEIVELIASRSLREIFGLVDGSEVTIQLLDEAHDNGSVR